MDRPPAPPEAVLIRLARDAAGIRVADAAARAGVSVARWSQVEAGSEVRNGNVSPVRARPGTIARMAREVHLTPERLAGEGRRPDAAEVLAEIIRQQDGPAEVAPLAVVTEPRPDQVPRKDVDFAAGIPPEELAPHVAAIEQAAYRALVDLAGAELPGPDDPDVRETMLSLPGKAVFPENEHDQRTWDNPVYSSGERVVFMARLRVLRARAVKEQRQRRAGTGLTGHIPASGAVPALISVGGKAYRASS